MKIRLQTSIAGADYSFAKDSVVRFDTDEAVRYIDSGQAMPADEEAEAAYDEYKAARAERTEAGSETGDDAAPAGERDGGEEAGTREGDSTADEGEAVDATPAAAELANTHGIPLASIDGTGENGRVLIGDVRKAVEAQA